MVENFEKKFHILNSKQHTTRSSGYMCSKKKFQKLGTLIRNDSFGAFLVKTWSKTFRGVNIIGVRPM